VTVRLNAEEAPRAEAKSNQKPGRIILLRAWKPLLNQRLWSNVKRIKEAALEKATAVAEPFEAVCQPSLISRVDKNTHLLGVKWSLVRIISYALSPSAVTCNYIDEQSSGPLILKSLYALWDSRLETQFPSEEGRREKETSVAVVRRLLAQMHHAWLLGVGSWLSNFVIHFSFLSAFLTFLILQVDLKVF